MLGTSGVSPGCTAPAVQASLRSGPGGCPTCAASLARAGEGRSPRTVPDGGAAALAGNLALLRPRGRRAACPPRGLAPPESYQLHAASEPNFTTSCSRGNGVLTCKLKATWGLQTRSWYFLETLSTGYSFDLRIQPYDLVSAGIGFSPAGSIYSNG